MKVRRLVFVLGALGAVSVPRLAAADCSSGADYSATVDGNTVTVCPTATARRCGSAIDLLRQSVADGTVVVVGNACSGSEGCYLDECVPPGTYRYGYATPYDCSEGGCGSVGLFSEATVTATLSPTCAPTGGGSGPTPTNATPPWGTGAAGASISRFKTSDGCGCTAASSGRTTVRILDLLAVGVGLLMMGLRARRGRGAVTRHRA